MLTECRCRTGTRSGRQHEVSRPSNVISREPYRRFLDCLILWIVLTAMLVGAPTADSTGIAGRDRRLDTCRTGAQPPPEQEGTACDVLIVSHAGGWGNVPLKYADDLRPIVLGTGGYLQSRGLRTKVIQCDRLPATPLGEFIMTAELWGLHNTCARRHARRLEGVLRKHPDLRVVMVGLSNGAAFANAVMAQLEDWAFDRAISVECGPPVYYLPVESDRSLTIIKQGEDPLFSGVPDQVLSNTVGVLAGMVVSLLSGSPLSFQAALRESGHEYLWPEIAPEVTGFIDRWLDDQTASPVGSHPGQQ